MRSVVGLVGDVCNPNDIGVYRARMRASGLIWPGDPFPATYTRLYGSVAIRPICPGTREAKLEWNW